MKSFTADWKTTVEDKKEGKMETTSQNFEKQDQHKVWASKDVIIEVHDICKN